MKVAVVTPTIGSDLLKQCIASVEQQTHQDLTHYIFIDGSKYASKVKKMIRGLSKVKTIEIEENIGKGWYGHRVYAACSFLVNADIICYLDEDNWYHPDHVADLVREIEKGVEWAYSLRTIHDKDGNYLCDDNCESLGKWSIFLKECNYHIDTSSYAVTKELAVRIGQAWYGQWGADRQFLHNLKTFYPEYSCTGKHTLCYRLEGNEESVQQDFFERGNKITLERCPEGYPWHQANELSSDS
jgi:glycosyltransferase involved in cell wall biosynthesis